MSAQFLICKFAVFICFHFIFISGSCDLHGSLADSLSRPIILIICGNCMGELSDRDIYMYTSYFELCVFKQKMW